MRTGLLRQLVAPCRGTGARRPGTATTTYFLARLAPFFALLRPFFAPPRFAPDFSHRPPYKRVWMVKGRSLLEFPPETRLFMCHDYPPEQRAPAWETTVRDQRGKLVQVPMNVAECIGPCHAHSRASSSRYRSRRLARRTR